MTPELQFRVSFPYIKNLYNPDNMDAHLAYLRKYKDEFLSKYEQLLPQVLTLVEKFSGYKWEEFAPPFIAVYIVDYPGKEFSDPLTLNTRDTMDLFLGIFIHELAHTIMPFRFKEPLFRETVMNYVAMKVLTELNIGTVGFIGEVNKIYLRAFKTPFEMPSWPNARTAIVNVA